MSSPILCPENLIKLFKTEPLVRLYITVVVIVCVSGKSTNEVITDIERLLD